MKKTAESEVLRCSFCNKDQNDVRKLIAGPTVFICDECVDVCNDIIADDRRVEGRTYKSALPVPHEIKKFLDEYVIGQDLAKKKHRPFDWHMAFAAELKAKQDLADRVTGAP